jgi:hypothetical protein
MIKTIIIATAFLALSALAATDQGSKANAVSISLDSQR